MLKMSDYSIQETNLIALLTIWSIAIGLATGLSRKCVEKKIAFQMHHVLCV